MSVDDYVKFRKQVETLKDMAMEFGDDSEAEAFYLLNVASIEIREDHLLDIEQLDQYYVESDEEEDEDGDIEGTDDLDEEQEVQEQTFKIKKPKMVLRGGKDDKGSDSKTSS